MSFNFSIISDHTNYHALIFTKQSVIIGVSEEESTMINDWKYTHVNIQANQTAELLNER